MSIYLLIPIVNGSASYTDSEPFKGSIYDCRERIKVLFKDNKEYRSVIIRKFDYCDICNRPFTLSN